MNGRKRSLPFQAIPLSGDLQKRISIKNLLNDSRSSSDELTLLKDRIPLLVNNLPDCSLLRPRPAPSDGLVMRTSPPSGPRKIIPRYTLGAVMETTKQSPSSLMFRICNRCGTFNTPSWRRCTETGRPLCNACGLNQRIYGRKRAHYEQWLAATLELNRQRQQEGANPTCRLAWPESIPNPDSVKSHIRTATVMVPMESRHCSNCQVTKTPVWRKRLDGEILCNACALYERTHDGPRPVRLGLNKILWIFGNYAVV